MRLTKLLAPLVPALAVSACTSPGYEPQSVPVASSNTRSPVVNIQLRSLKGSKAASNAAPE